MSHNRQKKIAVINDISGFGKCSVTAALPIISAMGVQCCPLPTAILSNHTEYPSYSFFDYTEHMENYMKEWKKLDLRFSGICTGFLGSERQIEIVEEFLSMFQEKETKVIVDPIMGDAGKTYETYTDELCERMHRLVEHADIITPNVTEACILTNTAYRNDFSVEDIKNLACKLLKIGPEKVVITGVEISSKRSGEETMIGNVLCEKGKEPEEIRIPKCGISRSGTGDVFSAVIAADAVNGVPFHQSVAKAAEFVLRCVKRSMQRGIPKEDGVCFEEELSFLIEKN